MAHEAATAKICRGCWEQLRVPVVLRGPLAAPYRLVGVRPSRMNPNICTICETMFEMVMRRRAIEIEATILFADIRGFTTLTQAMDSSALSQLLNFFYDECATAVWLHDGLLNKAIGDSILAIFNFPLNRQDHTAKALAAARDIQTRCHERCQRELVGYGLDVSQLGVGVGIDRGITTFGEFGTTHTDLTAVGQVVNRAARLQSVAGPGEILLSETAWQAVEPRDPSSQRRTVQLKGYETPQIAYAC